MRLNRAALVLLAAATLGITTVGPGGADQTAGTPAPAFVPTVCPAGAFPLPSISMVVATLLRRSTAESSLYGFMPRTKLSASAL